MRLEKPQLIDRLSVRITQTQREKIDQAIKNGQEPNESEAIRSALDSWDPAEGNR